MIFGTGQEDVSSKLLKLYMKYHKCGLNVVVKGPNVWFSVVQVKIQRDERFTDVLEQCQNYKYVGIIVSAEGESTQEIKQNIGENRFTI